MAEKKPSGTAIMTAYLRGYHASHDNPKIFDDSIANHMFRPEVCQAIEQQLARTASQMAPELAGECTDYESSLRVGIRVMAGPILARARYVEDRLLEAVENGVSQYVVLGAGFETFALRRSDLSARVQVFELDLPATQNIKQHIFARLRLKKPANLHFIPVDFTEETLDSALKRSTYDPERLSFFSWTGVTHYLPLEAIRSTLSTVVNLSTTGSEIVFDYWDTLAFDPEKASSRSKSLINSSYILGEPIITGLDPAELESLLAGVGLQLLENLGPSDIHKRYFQDSGSAYSSAEHVHLACARVM